MLMPDGTTEMCDHPVFYPSHIVGALEEHCPRAFDALSGQRHVSEWWESQPRDNPKFENHPMLLRYGWEMRALPIEVFGDGAKYVETSSLYTLCWGFKLGTGKILEKVFVFSTIPKELRLQTLSSVGLTCFPLSTLGLDRFGRFA
jgi:hypothetical protein